jgi:hypothetical protein
MANTDPVSGLYASLSRIRNRRPEGMALEAATAEQASTVQAQPKAIKSSRFMEVLPAPQQPVAQPIVQPTPQPQTPIQTPSMPPYSLEQPDVGPEAEVAVRRITNSLLDGDMDLDIPDAYLLSLGYLYGIKTPPPPQTNMETPPPLA